MTQLRSNAAMRDALDTRQAEEAAMTQQARRCPPLSADKLARQKPYQAKGGKPGYDGEPPRFEKAHGSEVRDPTTGAVVREGEASQQNVNASRVAYLFAKGLIEERQFLAAEKIAHDWQVALILPVASNVMVGAGGMHQLPNDTKCQAMDDHGAAVAALGRFWPAVEKVVIENKSVEKMGTELRPSMNSKRAMGWFDAALWILAEHYGFA